MSVRAPLGQVPSTLRQAQCHDKFYQAPSFSCVQHWKIERSLGTRLVLLFKLSNLMYFLTLHNDSHRAASVMLSLLLLYYKCA